MASHRYFKKRYFCAKHHHYLKTLFRRINPPKSTSTITPLNLTSSLNSKPPPFPLTAAPTVNWVTLFASPSKGQRSLEWGFILVPTRLRKLRHVWILKRGLRNNIREKK